MKSVSLPHIWRFDKIIMTRNYDKNRHLVGDSQRKNIKFQHGLSMLAFLSVLMCSPQAAARDPFVQEDPNPLIWRDLTTGFALDGFDPVSYFGTRGPRRGALGHEYGTPGAVWLFVNKGNLAAFKRNTDIYTPQFGGHGAYAMSNGKVVSPNPMIWHISDDRLYLFHSKASKTAWLYNEKSREHLAQKNWQAIVDRARYRSLQIQSKS